MEPSSRSRLSTRLVIAAACILVFLPVLFYGCDGEWVRWKAAVVIERYLDGEKELALQQLQDLVHEHPHSIGLKRQLAQWYLDAGQSQLALECCEELVSLRPGDPSIQQLLRDCLMATGRPEEALANYKTANRNRMFSSGGGFQHKNTLAYYRALAGQELEPARRDVESVVAQLEARWNSSQTLQLSATEQAAFCAAMLCRHCYLSGSSRAAMETRHRQAAEQALDVLAWQINSLEEAHSNWLAEQKRSTADAMAQKFPFDTKFLSRLMLLRGRVDKLASALSTFLTLRAMLWQELGRLPASYRDRLRVQQLGFDCEEIAAAFPTIQLCEIQLNGLYPVLDTRGCVYFSFGRSLGRTELPKAMADILAAVAGVEAVATASRIVPLTTLPLPTDSRERETVLHDRLERLVAVLLFHRSWIFNAFDQSQQAEEDFERIRQLGFVPGNQLF